MKIQKESLKKYKKLSVGEKKEFSLPPETYSNHVSAETAFNTKDNRIKTQLVVGSSCPPLGHDIG